VSPAVPYAPSPADPPFARVGGQPGVIAIVERFYDAMSELEPDLARLHPCDADGRVERASRDRFALFFIGWLGGPQDYVAQHGHPRLRMRHARVPVDNRMATAWMRCMRVALAEAPIEESVRAYLEEQLGSLALFLRNHG
jgi:hemoglobin